MKEQRGSRGEDQGRLIVRRRRRRERGVNSSWIWIVGHETDKGNKRRNNTESTDNKKWTTGLSKGSLRGVRKRSEAHSRRSLPCTSGLAVFPRRLARDVKQGAGGRSRKAIEAGDDLLVVKIEAFLEGSLVVARHEVAFGRQIESSVTS